MKSFVLAMAYNREVFRNKIEERIVGALFEYAFAIMANQNGQTKWVDHKLFEVNRLLDVELVKELTHMISGFKDRRKAALDVFNHVEKVVKPKMSLAQKLL